MKKLAFAVDNDAGLNSSISQHFGRAPCFVVVELNDKNESIDVVVHQNPFAGARKPGGVPNFVKTLNADTLVIGGIGQKAAVIFSRLDIKIISGVSGNVRTVLDKIIRGEIESSDEVCPGEHSGRDRVGH
jgi:predicted Fe-Mo cluster-binding NifX family protein